jgi:DNA adenine methylase
MPCGIGDFSNIMKQNLKEFKYKMSQMNIKFSNRNFTDFDIYGLTSDDMVYCDPPYLITTATYCDGKRGFEGWNEKYEKLLLQLLDKLDDMGVKFALSNVLSHKGKTNDILTEWHKKYNTYDIVKNYKTSNYQTSGKNNFETREVLITNYIPQIEHKKTLLDFISEL